MLQLLQHIAKFSKTEFLGTYSSIVLADLQVLLHLAKFFKIEISETWSSVI